MIAYLTVSCKIAWTIRPVWSCWVRDRWANPLWRERGLHGLEQALQTRDAGDPAQLRLDEANRRIGELSMEVELLRARCEKAGPFAGRRSRK